MRGLNENGARYVGAAGHSAPGSHLHYAVEMAFHVGAKHDRSLHAGVGPGRLYGN